MNERVLIVDKLNNPIGSATKDDVWRTGLWHRIVRVIITTPSGKFLSQQRGSTMELYPNCWTDTASGHVDAAESNCAAAHRELMEETGLNLTLAYAGTFAFKDRYEGKNVSNFNVIYRGLLEEEIMPVLSEEAQGFHWYLPEQIRELSQNGTLKITPTLLKTLEVLK